MVAAQVSGVYVREDVWGLPRWDPTLLWYAKAVGEMFPKTISDSSSWRFQAAIHGYIDTDPELLALMKPGEKLPAQTVQDTYWAKCQHASWYFLPWHRGYLGYFERIVRKTIIGLGGPADWALPYWNYNGAQPQSRLMRPEFLEATLPDGTPNPLFQSIKRGPYTLTATTLGQAGDFSIGPKDVSTKWDSMANFTDALAASSLGGGKTGYHHGEGHDPDPDAMGQLEKTPHGNIHNDVGEWMGSFETAGLDPIFWLHHSNIDRLWQVWLSNDPTRTNPPDTNWQKPRGLNLPFQFLDEAGASQDCDPQDVLNTETSKFTYKYANLNVTSPTTTLVTPAKPLALMVIKAPRPASTAPKMIGASTTNIAVGAQQTVTEVAIERPPELMLAVKTPGEEETYLNIENVTGTGRLSTQYVYLNLPKGGNPENYPELYAGSLPMFGVVEASLPTDEHGGHGRTFVLDVTELVDTLKRENHWNPEMVTVSVVPKRPLAEGASLTIGRISLYTR